MNDWCLGKKTEYSSKTINIYIQGVSKGSLQNFMGDSRHEGKHYSIGNHAAQTSSVGARGH